MLENLLRQREELLEKIRRIAETCKGIENEANARRVTELDSIGKSINDLSGSGLEKILQAIKNQRCFFFANNDKILFDRDTALIWANPNHFPHAPNNYTIMKDFIATKNSECWGEFDDWKIPTTRNLWQMIEDKTFPFQSGDNRRINDLPFRYVAASDGELRAVNLDGDAATRARKIQVHVLPCSNALVPDDYENNISPSN